MQRAFEKMSVPTVSKWRQKKITKASSEMKIPEETLESPNGESVVSF